MNTEIAKVEIDQAEITTEEIEIKQNQVVNEFNPNELIHIIDLFRELSDLPKEYRKFICYYLSKYFL